MDNKTMTKKQKKLYGLDYCETCVIGDSIITIIKQLDNQVSKHNTQITNLKCRLKKAQEGLNPYHLTATEIEETIAKRNKGIK